MSIKRVLSNSTHLLNSLWSRFFIVLLALTAINLSARKLDNFSYGPVLCTFRSITGLPCPFCGTTRAFGAFSQGQFLESLRLNPLAFILTFLVLSWVFFPRKFMEIKALVIGFWWRIGEKPRLLTSALLFLTIWILNLPRMLMA